MGLYSLDVVSGYISNSSLPWFYLYWQLVLGKLGLYFYSNILAEHHLPAQPITFDIFVQDNLRRRHYPED